MKRTRSFSMLYVVRERFPTYRVDLTDLFSVGICKLGHAIDWVMQADTPRQSETIVLRPNERVICGRAVPRSGAFGRLFNFLLALWLDLSVIGLVVRGQYDVVQVRDKFFAALVGLLAAKIKGIPFIYWMSFPYPESDANRWKESEGVMSSVKHLPYLVRGGITQLLLYQVILPLSDHVFVQSDAMLQQVARRGISPSKMTAIPMGILVSRLESTHVSDCHDPRLLGKRVIVYVGTMVAERKMEFLFPVLRIVLTQHPDAVLVMIGDADEVQMSLLHEHARRNGVDEHVVFTGFIPMEQAWGHVRHASVCVSYIRPHPILDVGTPTKVIEYLAWNRPIVANDHPDQSAVLSASGAGKSVPAELSKFAAAICEILSNHDAAEAIAINGLQYVKAHRSYEALSILLESKYAEILAEATPTASTAKR